MNNKNQIINKLPFQISTLKFCPWFVDNFYISINENIIIGKIETRTRRFYSQFTLAKEDLSNSKSKTFSVINSYCKFYFKVNEKHDIKVTALPDNATAHVHGGFDLILENI